MQPDARRAGERLGDVVGADKAQLLFIQYRNAARHLGDRLWPPLGRDDDRVREDLRRVRRGNRR